MENYKLITDFIECIWNKKQFDNIDNFIHDEYVDHSLPAAIGNDKAGLIKWINTTSTSFEHKTLIDDQVTENDKSIVKITMQMKHIGVWRNIAPTGIDVKTIGYRFYKIRDHKIIESWALVDGQALENQLKNTAHGCKIAD